MKLEDKKLTKESRKKKGKWRLLTLASIIVVIAVLLILASQHQTYLSLYMHYFQYNFIPKTEVENNSNAQFIDTDFLTVFGKSIMNQKGEKVVLMGVNLGGWLTQEYWMCPVYGDSSLDHTWSHTETINALTERFGDKKARALLKEYEDNWITEWDIQNIAAQGCNVIRVPFGYWNFMADDKGTWLTEEIEDNPGFQRFDWLLEIAGKHGIYVILDMHGCPGGQSYDTCDGTPGDYFLFSDSEYQDVMEKLWIAIAERYKDEPALAGYDIMNEAEYYSGSVESDPRNMVYNRMYQAIRAVDPAHIIFIEAIWELNCLPTPEQAGWENVVYETHPYDKSDAESYCNSLLEYMESNQIPIYIGECSSMKMLDTCKKYEISCTPWTYKGTNYAEGTWYMYYTDQLSAADVLSDSYWLIEMKWGKCLRTQFYEPVEEVLMYY